MYESQIAIPESLPAAVALEELVNSNAYLFGHGTMSRESANGAVSDGLRSRHTDLMSTAYGLEATADNPDAAVHDMALLREWPHYNAKYIVIIGIERLTGDDIPHRRYLQSIMQPRPAGEDFDEAYGEPYVVGKKFVAGYFDMNEGIFVPNATYDPKYDAGLLETTVNDDIQKERNPVDLFAGMAGGAAVKQEAVVAQQSDDDTPDVW